VEHHGQQRLSRCQQVVDHRRRGRVERVTATVVETELSQIATQTGLTITVCHLPPGTSKWNKIEQSCEVAENSFTGGDVGRVAAPPHFRRAGLAG